MLARDFSPYCPIQTDRKTKRHRRVTVSGGCGIKLSQIGVMVSWMTTIDKVRLQLTTPHDRIRNMSVTEMPVCEFVKTVKSIFIFMILSVKQSTMVLCMSSVF
ncbi:hypothetical protein ACOSQ3_019499 [Xanthoceras sorbifolium]